MSWWYWGLPKRSLKATGLSRRDRSMDITLCQIHSKHPCGTNFRVYKKDKSIMTIVCGHTVKGKNVIIISQRNGKIFRTELDKDGNRIV